MEPIEDVELDALLLEVTNSVKQERVDSVRKAISGIIRDIGMWQHQLQALEQQQRALESKITSAQGKLEKLRNNDWSVLKEEKPIVDKATNENKGNQTQ